VIKGILGATELMSQLQSMGDMDARRILKDAAEETLLPEAQRLVPVDKGDLKASLEVVASSDGADLQAGTDHAVHVEFGTRFMAAQPYLRPAYENRGNEFIRLVGDAVQADMKGKSSE
jgi:HK97 gp10 family phage protein